MRCAALSCLNSEETSKTKNIIYHAMPSDQKVRKKWLKIVDGRKSKMFICSEHFSTDDYDDKNQLKPSAVPVLANVCRICFATDTKFYGMDSYNFIQLYQQITGIAVDKEDKLPQKLCWECAHRLTTSSNFRAKALRSHALMLDLVSQHTDKCLTTTIVKSVDRNAHNLTSSLVHKAPQNDMFDEIIEYNTDTNTWDDDTQDIQPIQEINVDLKAETESVNFEIEDNSVSSSDVALSEHKKELESVKICEPKVDRRRKPANEILNEDIFEISELSFNEQIDEIQKRRESTNFKNSEHKCLVCFKGFVDEEAYNGHMLRHTDKTGIHECLVCKVHFKTQHYLRNHATSHTQRFTCKRCGYVTTRRHAAKLHEHYHNGARYECPHCLDIFVKFSTYMSHVRIKHPSDFVCESCGHSFVSDKGLRLHKKLKHRFDGLEVQDDGPYCSKCDIRFVSDGALDTHLKVSSRHSDNMSAKDPVKQRRRRNLERCDNNVKKRNPTQCKPSGPIQCEQCDMQLPDSSSYYRHFRRTHPDKNRTNYPSMKSKSMCEVCGKMFQSRALLQDHSWTHTDSKQFKCLQCNKSFQRKYRLIAHRRLHDTQRTTHACTVCGKHFSTTSNMQRHMFSHTGLKPFKCEMCGKAFKHASEKRVHVTYVHLKKPWPKRTRGKRKPDGRMGPQPQQPATTEREVDVVQPVWPSCDPKLSVISDKSVYYNLKM